MALHHQQLQPVRQLPLHGPRQLDLQHFVRDRRLIQPDHAGDRLRLLALRRLRDGNRATGNDKVRRIRFVMALPP